MNHIKKMKISSSIFLVVVTALLSPSFIGATFVENDECLNAIRIDDDMLPYANVENGTAASFNPRDPLGSCLYEEILTEGNTMWYQYDSKSDGVLIINMTNSMVDPRMALYTGKCRRLKEVFCVSDEYEMYVEVKRGVTYYLKTGDYDFDFYGTGIRSLSITKVRNYFYVIDDITNSKYSLLYDLFKGQYSLFPVSTIDYSQLANPSLSIASEFTDRSSSVRSVYLTVDNQPAQAICENRAPYTLFGDAGGDVFGSIFTLGNRVVTATAYSRPNCIGNVVGQLQQSFLVRGCDKVTFNLYDAKYDKYVKGIADYTVISNPPCDMNIDVKFTCGFTPKNVQFKIIDATTNAVLLLRNDTSPPYFMFGDNGSGDILPGSIPEGNYLLSAIIDGIVHTPVNFTIEGQCRSEPLIDTTFDIDLRFLSWESPRTAIKITAEQAQMFQPVIDRLSSMIIGDKPDVVNTSSIPSSIFCGDFPPLIDDLYICTGLLDYNDDNDEYLGFVLDSYVRESDGLPFASTILFDTQHFQTLYEQGLAGNYIIQQLIQTLGVGGQWADKGFADSAEPCSYNGTRAKAEFLALTGCSANIPLEYNALPTLGFDFLDCLYWDRNCLKNEVLTYSLGQKKVSRVTLGSLEDLGYQVNYTTADPYGPADIGVCAGCNDNRRDLIDATPVTSCHEGGAFERAVHKGKDMLGMLHEHHVSQPESFNLPKGVVYKGNQHITVAYRHEDGTMCSVVVTSSGDVF